MEGGVAHGRVPAQGRGGEGGLLGGGSPVVTHTPKLNGGGVLEGVPPTKCHVLAWTCSPPSQAFVLGWLQPGARGLERGLW